jgi:tetratricopeptide (TPR) repeat protein
MSSRLPSRWLFAAALLAAPGLISAAAAQTPAPPDNPKLQRVPQTTPAPWPVYGGPFRLVGEPPLLLEEEQTSEHVVPLRTLPPAMPTPPRVMRGCGMPDCDRDDRMPADEVTLRCLLFTINPLAAFLPIQTWIVDEEVEAVCPPPAAYLEHPPQYIPPSPFFPLPREQATQFAVEQAPEPIGMPVEIERIEVMPDEESEPHYQLLGPWIDSARLFRFPVCPLAEVQVTVHETQTGSLLFGVNGEVSKTGTIIFCAEPPAATAPAPIPVAPRPVPAVPTGGRCCAAAAAAPQVQIDLVIAEVDRKGARKLNLDRAIGQKAARWVIEDADEARWKALQGGLVGLREKGHAKLLAEPRLISLSGQMASILIGGQRAVRMPDGFERIGVDFEDFGTRVNCRPVVQADGTIRLEVEPELSELCETAGTTVEGAAVPGRSSQRVHTMADVAPGHTLVISGPKAGGDTRFVLFVTPTVAKGPTATEVPPMVPQMIFDFGNAVRSCLELFELFSITPWPTTPDQRVLKLMNESENIRQIEVEMQRFPTSDQPSHLTPERVHGGVGQDEAMVHDLLLKCQRELSRGHYAGAEDMAQQAIERDRQQVAADPLVAQSDLLQRVKATASLPLGTVEPCGTKAEGSNTVPRGEGKAIGSPERMVEALMEEFHFAYKEARYRDAMSLAGRAVELDPCNPAAAAALKIATTQRALRFVPSVPEAPPTLFSAVVRRQVAELTARSYSDLDQGRYEEARAAALQALSVAPGDPVALTILRQAVEGLSRRPQPESVPQCTYVGTSLRPMLPPVDPAVVSALQKLLIDGEKFGPTGATEEAEPKEGNDRRPRR